MANLLDLFVLLYVIYFLIFGFYRGFFRQIFDLLVLILSFYLAFTFYHSVGSFFASQFHIASSFGDVLGFFAIWFAIEILYYILFVIFYNKIPEKIRDSKINHYGGLAPALLRALLSIWVIVSLALILPLSQNSRSYIESSFTGKNVGKTSKVVEKYLGDIFEGAVDKTLDFLTVKPDSNEKIDLGFTETNVTVDTAAENEMLKLVNKERADRGLKPLVMDEKLQDVARAHSRDMFAKGYFAHDNLEGESPFDRMDKAGIKYFTAGENLALAPDVETAHKGLMNSPGHRANILTADFRKVGIGVIASKKYGLMFSQEFTD